MRLKGMWSRNETERNEVNRAYLRVLKDHWLQEVQENKGIDEHLLVVPVPELSRVEVGTPP